MNAGEQRAPWGAIFDIDGTMVNNADFHEKAWIELGRRRSLPIDAVFYRDHIHGRSNPEILVTLFGEDGDQALKDAVAWDKEAIYREVYRPQVSETPGLCRLIRELNAAGVPCACATNAPVENAVMVIEELGIADCFRLVLTPDDVPVGKPAPDLFWKAADGMGVPRGRCVVFEDSPAGFRAAAAAGMPCIAITYGAHAGQTPPPAGLRVERDFSGITAAALEDWLERQTRAGCQTDPVTAVMGCLSLSSPTDDILKDLRGTR